MSDASCADKIIQLYEQKEEGRPLFVFNVTMQNHGGYDQTYTNFSPGISVDGVNSISVSQYFSLIKLSDQALEQLIDYFSGADEKTVIVFFGDHQPSDTVAAPILAMNGMQWNALDEEQQKLRYQVPYVIWANYDIDEECGYQRKLSGSRGAKARRGTHGCLSEFSADIKGSVSGDIGGAHRGSGRK